VVPAGEWRDSSHFEFDYRADHARLGLDPPRKSDPQELFFGHNKYFRL
jgi:hypothetical protein